MAAEQPGRGQAYRILIGAAAFVVVIAGLRAAEPIVIPFLYAVFVAILVAPPLTWLRRHGFSALSSTILVTAGILVVALLAIPYVSAPVADFVAELPRYRDEVRGTRTELIAWLKQLGVDTHGLEQQGEYLNTDDAVGWVGSIVSSLGDAAGDGLLILFIAVFLLAEAGSFPAKLQALPHAAAAATRQRIAHVIGDIRRYMIIKTWISLVNGVLVALCCLLVGVKYAPLWGLLTFFTNYIPNIGSLIAAVPTVLVALADRGLTGALLMAGGFLVVEGFSGYVLEPRWASKDLGISPLVVFLSMVFWGWVLGPAGMLLSVPLTIAVKIALESDPSTRWIALLLGSESDPVELERSMRAIEPVRVPILTDPILTRPPA